MGERPSRVQAQFNREELITARRCLVAQYRLRGCSGLEIARRLKEEHPELCSLETGEAFGRATIINDLNFLAEEWKREALEATDLHKARVLAEIQEVTRAAWQINDLASVLAALKQKRELLGLDAPKRTDITSGGEPIKTYQGVDLDKV